MAIMHTYMHAERRKTTYIHRCIHARIHRPTCVYTHINAYVLYIHTVMHTPYTHIHAYALFTHTFMHAPCTHIHAHALYMHIHVYVIHMLIFMYTFCTHTHTHTHTFMHYVSTFISDTFPVWYRWYALYCSLEHTRVWPPSVPRSTL